MCPTFLNPLHGRGTPQLDSISGRSLYRAHRRRIRTRLAGLIPAIGFFAIAFAPVSAGAFSADRREKNLRARSPGGGVAQLVRAAES